MKTQQEMLADLEALNEREQNKFDATIRATSQYLSVHHPELHFTHEIVENCGHCFLFITIKDELGNVVSEQRFD